MRDCMKTKAQGDRPYLELVPQAVDFERFHLDLRRRVLLLDHCHVRLGALLVALN